jgi:hypothetical protein
MEGAMEWYLPLIWAGIIGTAVVLYVILDGCFPSPRTTPSATR